MQSANIRRCTAASWVIAALLECFHKHDVRAYKERMIFLFDQTIKILAERNSQSKHKGKLEASTENLDHLETVIK